MSSDKQKDVIDLVVEVAVAPEHLDKFLELMGELVEVTRREPGTLRYEWLFTGDRTTCHIRETYADGPAFLAHFSVFVTTYAGRFVTLGKTTRVVMYADPPADVREAVASFSPVYMTELAGFRQ
jgi:quinol monooxygenase YgiN